MNIKSTHFYYKNKSPYTLMRRKSHKLSGVRKSRRRKSIRKSRRRKSVRKSRRRKSVRKSRRRKSVRKSRRRKSIKLRFFGSNKNSTHYLCKTNKGVYRCNRYSNKSQCKSDENHIKFRRSTGTLCTTNKSKCENNCAKAMNKFYKNKGIKHYAYKCDPYANLCKKYDSLEKCMYSLSPTENTAGIKCSTNKSSCLQQCTDIQKNLAKMKSGQRLSNVNIKKTSPKLSKLPKLKKD